LWLARLLSSATICDRSAHKFTLSDTMMSGRRSGLSALFARHRSGDGDALGDIVALPCADLHALAAVR